MATEKRLRAILWESVSSGAQAVEEKASLPEQDRRLREIAERDGWDIIDVIVVPGHSRDYYTYLEFAQGAAAEKITAPMRMFDHWRQRDFDVFACLDGSRFGREQSIFAEVVARTIDAGAVIYSIKDSWIDKRNRRMYVSMAGYAAAGEIDEIQRRRTMGMQRRAERGLPMSSRIPITHRLIRNERGKADRLEVDESKRRLWDDLATLVLEGVGWNSITDQLYIRFGHVDETTGQPYPISLPYRLLMNPLIWGHIEQHHHYPWKLGNWVFDAHEAPPDGVTVERNVVPPLYVGELAERIKAEIRRRQMTINGTARPENTHRYTGLVVCGSCGGAMAVSFDKKDDRYYLYCNHRYYNKTAGRDYCDQRKGVPYKRLNPYVHDVLVRLLVGEQLTDIYEIEKPTAKGETLEREVAEVRLRISRLILEQAGAPESAQAHYREAVRTLSEREVILCREYERETASAGQWQHLEAERDAAVADLREIGLERFWQSSSRDINQLLHRIMGNYQFVAYNGKIIRLAERRRGRK